MLPKYHLLDSNILIGFLNGDTKIANWLFIQRKENSHFTLNISVITKIEVLSLKTLARHQIEEAEKFLETFRVVNIDNDIVHLASALKREGFLSLGDAIIAASAISNKLTFVTNDKTLRSKTEKFTEVISVK